jgi:hypothetical protein
MTREYRWTIHSLETVSVVPDKPKLVTFIHCGLSATETLPDNSVMHDGVGGVLCVYGGNGDDIDNFTPYNQLTEEQVTSWLMTVTPQADRDAMKTKLDNIITWLWCKIIIWCQRCKSLCGRNPINHTRRTRPTRRVQP